MKINGEVHYLWRAVDHEGEILESFVTKKRDKSAAFSFMKKALKRHGRVEKIVTDGLRSYPAPCGNWGFWSVVKWANGSTIGSRIAIFHSDDESVRCFVSGG